jgi:putative hydrolase of the HAD superfamily
VLQQVLVRWHVSTPVNEVLLLWNRVDVVPGMLPLANGLRSKGVVVGLATNQQQYRMNHMVGTVELEQYFDHSFYSCEIGATKPSAEYFSRVIGSLGLPPENVLLVDDSTGNIAGALASGLQGLQFEARMHVNPATTLREKLAVLHMIG